MRGMDDLARGELKFYQADINSAEFFINGAMNQGRENKQLLTVQMALFYTLRIAVFQGNCEKAEQALKEMEFFIRGSEFPPCFICYGIAFAWYACIPGLPENIPHWLRGRFSSYGHASFMENFENQAKARYCYISKNYAPLLAYIEEQKKRESVLFGRLEMLVMEACIHYKMRDKRKACELLSRAYAVAHPNNLLMPFIEFGKDMRTLTAFALREYDCGIPRPWLELVNSKAVSYARRQAHLLRTAMERKII